VEIFTEGNENSISKVDGKENEYEQQQERDMVRGNGNENPIPHLSTIFELPNYSR